MSSGSSDNNVSVNGCTHLMTVSEWVRECVFCGVQRFCLVCRRQSTPEFSSNQWRETRILPCYIDCPLTHTLLLSFFVSLLVCWLLLLLLLFLMTVAVAIVCSHVAVHCQWELLLIISDARQLYTLTRTHTHTHLCYVCSFWRDTHVRERRSEWRTKGKEKEYMQ